MKGVGQPPSQPGSPGPRAVQPSLYDAIPDLKPNWRPRVLTAVMDGSSCRLVAWAVGSDRTGTLTALAM